MGRGWIAAPGPDQGCAGQRRLNRGEKRAGPPREGSQAWIFCPCPGRRRIGGGEARRKEPRPPPPSPTAGSRAGMGLPPAAAPGPGRFQAAGRGETWKGDKTQLPGRRAGKSRWGPDRGRRERSVLALSFQRRRPSARPASIPQAGSSSAQISPDSPRAASAPPTCFVCL